MENLRAYEQKLTDIASDLRRARDEMARVIVGQEEVLELCLAGVLAGGHILIEGVPGLGKTEMVKTIAQVLDCKFSRIQFTPDLLPMDITGTHVLVGGEKGAKSFEFRPGPIFANVVLADEINRATPKTQAALLEAMQEQSVTVGRDTFELEQPFAVIATQNPIEMEGTYPLPEAQVDRFLLKLMVRFPSREQLSSILDRTTAGHRASIDTVLDRQRIMEIRRLGLELEIPDSLRDLVVAFVVATHPDRPESPEPVRRFVRYGASPRGGQAVILCAKLLALMRGRAHVAEQDLRDVLAPALRHRILLSFEGEAEGLGPDDVLAEVARAVSLDSVI